MSFNIIWLNFEGIFSLYGNLMHLHLKHVLKDPYLIIVKKYPEMEEVLG